MSIAEAWLELPTGLTFEEYQDWCDQEEIRAEWVDGEIVPLSPNTLKHQSLSRFLISILHPYVQERRLGEVLHAPFAMKLERTRSGREPDVLFVSRENLSRLKETHLDGPADLAIEIVSPESRIRDREIKRSEYERAGVREYWLLDPEEKTAEFLQLGEDGRYRIAEVGERGTYRSVAVEGLWIRVAWLWEQPPLRSVMDAWELY